MTISDRISVLNALPISTDQLGVGGLKDGYDMTTPSRMMPPRKDSKLIGPVGLTVLFAIVGGLIVWFLWAAFTVPVFTWIIGPFVVTYGLFMLRSERHWVRMKAERKNESICAFARMLPARKHDTWVVRAVYEELSSDRQVAIRPTDRLEMDLGFLPEDLEDCVTKIARRAGRALAITGKNPLYGRVVTVKDIISFLECQPEVWYRGCRDRRE